MPGILDYISNPAFANQLMMAGETFKAIDQGRPANLAPFMERGDQLQTQARMDKMRQKLVEGGILQKLLEKRGYGPEAFGVLSGALDAAPGAVLPSVLGLAFPGGADDKPYSDIGKLRADLKAGRITQAEYDAKVAKITATSGGIGLRMNPETGEMEFTTNAGPDWGNDPDRKAPTAIDTEALKARNAYDSVMKGLDRWGALVAEHGATVMPGQVKDSIATERRNLQLQMKELYNLGVLNGPDLMLMDQMLVDPTSIPNYIMDFFGLADMKERGASNLELVKQIMKDLVEPKLKTAGRGTREGAGNTGGSMKSPGEMTDEELREEAKRLGIE